MNILRNKKIDKVLLIPFLILLVIGIITFISTASGFLSSDETKFFSVIKSQLFFFFLISPIFFFVGYLIPYKIYKKKSLIIFVVSILIAFLVFVPGIGFEFNGANRWIHIFNFSLQPTELIKFSAIIIIAAFFSEKIKKGKWFEFKTTIIISAICGVTLLFQKDFGTLSIILFSILFIFLASRASLKKKILIIVLGIVAFFIILKAMPHMMDRFQTFLNPDKDILGTGYQLRQSKIAVGSGEFFGRGIGKSIQKFENYLPEKISDSIFSIFAEETGFIGSLFLLSLLFFIIFRIFLLAKRSQDLFAKFVLIGIVAGFCFQITLNIASSIGFFPLSGVPLPFFSKGGTNLILYMFEFGVIMNISKHVIKKID